MNVPVRHMVPSGHNAKRCHTCTRFQLIAVFSEKRLRARQTAGDVVDIPQGLKKTDYRLFSSPGMQHHYLCDVVPMQVIEFECGLQTHPS